MTIATQEATPADGVIAEAQAAGVDIEAFLGHPIEPGQLRRYTAGLRAETRALEEIKAGKTWRDIDGQKNDVFQMRVRAVQAEREVARLKALRTQSNDERLATMDAERESMLNQIASLDEQLTQAKEQLQATVPMAASDEVKMLRAKNEALSINNRQLGIQRRTSEDRVETVLGEQRDFKKKIVELTAELEAARGAVQGEDSALLKQARDERDDLMATVARLTGELARQAAFGVDQMTHTPGRNGATPSTDAEIAIEMARETIRLRGLIEQIALGRQAFDRIT